ATISGSTVTIVSAGTSTIEATQTASGSYSSGTIITTFTVNPIAPTIGTLTIPAKNYGDVPFTITAPTSNSSGAFTYTSSNTNVATIALPGIDWTIRNSAVDNSWNSVVIGNGLWVAVSYTGSGNRVMTSPDGINWTSRTTPVDNQWLSVAYGNGLWVAVAQTGSENSRVMTSPNGINWTIRTSAADNSWKSVAYGNGLWVAVSGSGSGNRVMTSPDGINWTIRTNPVNNNWSSVAYGNGVWVGVAYSGSGNRVMTSSGDSINIIGAGSSIITATQSASGNYASGTVVATLTVNQIAPTIGTLTVTAKDFGTSPFSLTAPTSNSNGAFTYTSSNTTVATISGSTVTIVGAGTTTITATQASTTNYTLGTVVATLTVNQIAPTLSNFTIAAKNYGSAPFNLVAPTSNSGGAFTYTSSNTDVATIIPSNIFS
ncbi:MAG: hypothetical protein EB170_09130, partial [Nitrosopumilaceae archaeon]|nr:hypothetical protein [Nitrosopumilaceae archaeon]